MFRGFPPRYVLILCTLQIDSTDPFDWRETANLDPTGKSTDAELWSALEQCRLKEHVESMGELHRLSCLSACLD